MPDKPANYERITDGKQFSSDEAWLLARISDQLADLQDSVNRLEAGAGEFLPWLRTMMSRRSTRAAAAASSMFRGGQL